MNRAVGSLYAAVWRAGWRVGYHTRRFRSQAGAARLESYDDVRSRMATTDRRSP